MLLVLSVDEQSVLKNKGLLAFKWFRKKKSKHLLPHLFYFSLLNEVKSKERFRPRPHLMRFCLNDAYISMRLGLLSPLIRLAFSSKTQRFEIALESGSKFKRKHIVLV